MNKENFIDKKPKIKEGILWYTDTDKKVTLKLENKGFFCRLLKKPRLYYIHLDELGSFVWLQVDGKKDIYEIGKKTEEKFGSKTAPLFERMIKYFKILESYKLVEWAK